MTNFLNDPPSKVHEQTGRNLHSHNFPAPLTKGALEVSCYGNATIGDVNDHWKVERIDVSWRRLFFVILLK
jgi:dolichyl-phosphate-mannose-protein mannosyltransferase